MSRVWIKACYQWNDARQDYVLNEAESAFVDGYQGPLGLCCGASSQQYDVEASQQNFYNYMTTQAQDQFTMAQGLFNELTNEFSPILAAGPNQQGYSQAQLDTLNSSALTQTGQNYNKAAKALNENIAAQGGGNVAMPSGVANQQREQIATSAAGMESGLENQILTDSYNLGHQNWLTAASVLGSAPSVFGTAGSISNSATSAGSAASTTANEITQAQNSWMGLVGGVLGSAANVAETYMKT